MQAKSAAEYLRFGTAQSGMVCKRVLSALLAPAILQTEGSHFAGSAVGSRCAGEQTSDPGAVASQLHSLNDASCQSAKSQPAEEDKTVLKDDLKTLAIAEVEKRLGSSPEGLTGAEASKRLAKDGPNELPLKTENELLKFNNFQGCVIEYRLEAVPCHAREKSRTRRVADHRGGLF